jgi:hypothetical protein
MPISIRIKRGTGAAPASLLRGELAYYEDEQRLYIGEGDSGTNDANGLPIAQTVRELTTPATLLSNLGDTDVVTLSDGDVLVYDVQTSKWSAQSPAFAPAAHKASHATGGTDAMSPSDIGAAAATHSHAWSDITSGVPSTFTPASHSHTVTLEISGLIESPEAKTYIISPAIPAAITITNVKAKTSAGTVDIKLQDDGVDIADTTIGDVGTSVSSPASEPSAAVASGSVLALVVSDLQSSPADLAFSIHYTVASANNA